MPEVGSQPSVTAKRITPTIATQKLGVLAPISEMMLATRSKSPPGRTAASEPVTIETDRMIGRVTAASISVVGNACSTTSIAGRENWMDWPRSKCSSPIRNVPNCTYSGWSKPCCMSNCWRISSVASCGR